jgi:hypothetical protein
MQTMARDTKMETPKTCKGCKSLNNVGYCEYQCTEIDTDCPCDHYSPRSKSIKISVLDQSLNTITCGHCERETDGSHWSSETDMLGNNFVQCPWCYKESLLVNDDENIRGE